MKPPSRNCCQHLLYHKAGWGTVFCTEILLMVIHFATGLRFSVQALLLFSWCLFSASPRPGTPLPCSQYPWEHSHCSTAENRDSVSTFTLEIHSSSSAWESALPSYRTQSLRIGFSTLILYSCVHCLSRETFFARIWKDKRFFPELLAGKSKANEGSFPATVCPPPLRKLDEERHAGSSCLSRHHNCSVSQHRYRGLVLSI